MVQPGRRRSRSPIEQPAKALDELKQIQGLIEKLAPLGVTGRTTRRSSGAAAAEFLLEGMCAHRRISRNEERVLQRRGEKKPEAGCASEIIEPDEQPVSAEKQFN